jgi:hypothetical protein
MLTCSKEAIPSLPQDNEIGHTKLLVFILLRKYHKTEYNFSLSSSPFMLFGATL